MSDVTGHVEAKINGKVVKEAGLAEIPLNTLRPNINYLRDPKVKKIFESWFNWPRPEYSPDFIIIHPSLEPFITPHKPEDSSIDLIVDKKNEFHLSIRYAILGQYEGSRSIDGIDV